MNLVCPYCGFTEYIEGALYCRDCGTPYLQIEQPEVIYTGGNESTIAVHNHYQEELEIEALDLLQKESFSEIQYYPTTLPKGKTTFIKIRFKSLPRFLEAITTEEHFTFQITIRNMNNLICVRKKHSFIFAPEPQVYLKDAILEDGDQDTLIVNVCPTTPLELSLPVAVRHSTVLLRRIRIDGIEIKTFRPPLRVVPDTATEDIHLCLDDSQEFMAALNKKDALDSRLEFECAGLGKPIVLPIHFRHVSLPRLCLYREIWTSEGHQDRMPVDGKDGLVYHTGHGETHRRRIIIDLAQKTKYGQGYAQVKLYGIDSPLKTVNIKPIGTSLPFILPAPKRLELVIDGARQSKHASVDFSIFSRTTQHSRTKISFDLSINCLKKTAYPHFIGLDFGTSNSCMSICMPAEEKGVWCTVPLTARTENLSLDSASSASEQSDAQIIPTILNPKAEKGSLDRIGRNVANAPRHLKKSMFKRFVSKSESAAEEIITFLEELFRRMESALLDMGIPLCRPERVIMAVPTGFSFERQLLRGYCCEALRRRGVNEPKVRLIDESLAAMTYFFANCSQEENRIGSGDFAMIIDFGGGTTDITVVQKQKQSYFPVVSGGNPELGGKEITEWISDRIQIGISEAEALKIRLARQSDWDIYTKALSLEIERQSLIDELHKWLKGELWVIFQDILIDLKELMDGTLDVRTPNNIMILLAGGSSALEGFLDLVSQTVGCLIDHLGMRHQLSLNDVHLISEPKKGVSRGAFIYKNEGVLNFPADNNISPFRVLFPLPAGANPDGHKIIEADIKNRVEAQSVRKRFAVLIDRNQQVPTPENEKHTLTLEDLDIIRATYPFQIYTQIGSAQPVRYPFEPDGSVPDEISSGTSFSTYLDQNNNVRLEICEE